MADMIVNTDTQTLVDLRTTVARDELRAQSRTLAHLADAVRYGLISQAEAQQYVDDAKFLEAN